ncbi:MAG: pilus assembly protein [Planctomycetia bacterium]|nr:pilus assembly protein [Planctomycetia bacterium]
MQHRIAPTPNAVPRLLRRKRHRKATTTVEFAIVCPLLFTLFCGAIEFARCNQIVNAVALSSYQGCRRAIVPGATAANTTAAVNTVLSANLITGGTVTINPTTITNATTTVTVTVSVNLTNNAWITPKFTSAGTITRSCTLTREKTN